MKIIFRQFRWIFRRDWYTTCRFKTYRIIDCGWFSLIFNIVKCGCGKKLTKQEINNPANKDYKDKICNNCMIDYVNHAITGE